MLALRGIFLPSGAIDRLLSASGFHVFQARDNAGFLRWVRGVGFDLLRLRLADFTL